MGIGLCFALGVAPHQYRRRVLAIFVRTLADNIAIKVDAIGAGNDGLKVANASTILPERNT